ncbi:MAG: protein-L-isoaspartate(D-aspartate) O-methyltransferase [Solirubrobacteraceae bacterium]|nr:protein-L-isoaspartate(D-aspartate) O-methyltransferase [Solirubrobacteraceae bacterium]
MDRDDLVRSLRSRVRDERVLAAIASLPREVFVEPELSAVAYADCPLPIGAGQTISQPAVVAGMCEALELQPSDRVLDVGTGSGYHAAVMSRLCAHVHGIELEARLAERATLALARAGIENVTVAVGDGQLGLPDEAPFDAINVAATAREAVPAALEQQLAVGGRLIAPVALHGEEHLVLVRRTPDGLERTRLAAVRFVPLR